MGFHFFEIVWNLQYNLRFWVVELPFGIVQVHSLSIMLLKQYLRSLAYWAKEHRYQNHNQVRNGLFWHKEYLFS